MGGSERILLSFPTYGALSYLRIPPYGALSYLRNLKSLSLLQLVPVRLFGTGQAAHIHEEKNREGVILLKLGKFTTGNWEGL